MEIPNALLVELTRSIDKRNRQFIQRDFDHAFYSNLIEQARIDERKWIGECIQSGIDKHKTAIEFFDWLDTTVSNLKSGKRPE